MNFTELFTAQKKYEESISYKGEDRFKKKILALLVEVGESANERPSLFKFWSKSHKGSAQKTAEKYAEAYQQPVIPVDEDLFLEELVDIFSFILSQGLEIGIDGKDIAPPIIDQIFDDSVDLYLLFAQRVLNLYTSWKMEKLEKLNANVYSVGTPSTEEAFNQLLGTFFALALVLEYELSDIETAYYKKNAINVKRQDQGY
ncbi:dUTP diphosphatase [Priestia megaterium]|uniref:dUTP diphosphatase n=1 Tax=Priestia megaterium TaxID=1404 RepID=UPI0015D4B0D7|nr:dUTP diphosphatase [Priestia megaterium]